MDLLRPGRCLLALRIKEAGLTQVELSDRVGISQPMLSHFATNRKIMSLTAAKRIADTLHCSIEQLYTWEV
jgi:transcriptional regulator with XRE-family HTH domain